MTTDSKQIPWDAVAYVKASQNRTDVLLHLAQQPQTASDIADKTPMTRQTVSVTIGHMREDSKMGSETHDLLECLTPDRQHHRIYGLTETGELVAEQL